ncbi:hypothetical protein SAMN05428975_4131 [Mucilaginibacter sp. OK268]|uniref:hypothetical protein n=1 Tax=Mucilaginibacter sp. OK268 TaxID=1881048 RepID=UPI00088230F7|nr:hypothetical protein [Mucilaginibacter sp. OK268]SDP95493.1 hypothetical protein SAMN05428975_4131 [Mucilaginibacter sp. OK268]
MKKILTLVCCTILLAATSCTKKYVTPSNRTVFFTVKGGTNASNTGDWVLNTDPTSGTKSYLVNLGKNGELPELDSFTQANDGVIVSISGDNGGTYELLPQTYSGVAYSVTHSKSLVQLFAQTPDGTAALLPTRDLLVKVVLVDSQPQ